VPSSIALPDAAPSTDVLRAGINLRLCSVLWTYGAQPNFNAHSANSTPLALNRDQGVAGPPQHHGQCLGEEAKGQPLREVEGAE
jgi:hypothetical protein